jgi:hypothetical protein
MEPHIIFNFGNKAASYYHQTDLEYNMGKYTVSFVNECNSYILFSFGTYSEILKTPDGGEPKGGVGYVGIYDKKSKTVHCAVNGFTLDGIPVPFYPDVVNEKDEMVAPLNPEDLLKHKAQIGVKYKALLQDLQEDDNPVLIIGTLK